jgi:hypothetical protein
MDAIMEAGSFISANAAQDSRSVKFCKISNLNKKRYNLFCAWIDNQTSENSVWVLKSATIESLVRHTHRLTFKSSGSGRSPNRLVGGAHSKRKIRDSAVSRRKKKEKKSFNSVTDRLNTSTWPPKIIQITKNCLAGFFNALTLSDELLPPFHKLNSI